MFAGRMEVVRLGGSGAEVSPVVRDGEVTPANLRPLLRRAAGIVEREVLPLTNVPWEGRSSTEPLAELFMELFLDEALLEPVVRAMLGRCGFFSGVEAAVVGVDSRT